jgi:hypothetical protein
MARSSLLEVSNSTNSPNAVKSNLTKSPPGSQQSNGSTWDGERGLGPSHTQGKSGVIGVGWLGGAGNQKKDSTSPYSNTPDSLRLDLANVSSGPGGGEGEVVVWISSPRSLEVTPRSMPPAHARASAARRSVKVKATSKSNQNDTGWVSPRSIPTNANIGNLLAKPSPRAMPSPRTTASPRTPRAGLPLQGTITTPTRVPAPLGVWR